MRLDRRLALRLAVHVGALVPVAWLAFDIYTGRLSPNPIQDITFRTGKPALVLLVLSLACTPLSSAFGWRELIPHRRTLGLYAFGYACLHFLVFAGLDYTFFLDADNRFSGDLLVDAILEKRYALVGFSAFLILLSLALTSTKGWQRRLGKRWKKLHRLVYVAAILVIVHYVWLVKSDVGEPLAYGAIVLALLMARTARGRAFLARIREARRGRGMTTAPAELPAVRQDSGRAQAAGRPSSG
jgi:sulfoxide reductase heme-binding subunit YedZ